MSSDGRRASPSRVSPPLRGVPVTIFNEKMAAWVEENVEKGHKVYVEGRISSGSYGEGDNRKFSTDLIVDKFNSLED